MEMNLTNDGNLTHPAAYRRSQRQKETIQRLRWRRWHPTTVDLNGAKRRRKKNYKLFLLRSKARENEEWKTKLAGVSICAEWRWADVFFSLSHSFPVFIYFLVVRLAFFALRFLCVCLRARFEASEAVINVVAVDALWRSECVLGMLFMIKTTNKKTFRKHTARSN